MSWLHLEFAFYTGALVIIAQKAQTKADRASEDGAQAAFIRLYLGSVVALEREVPQTLTLHPFTLEDLNCAQIRAQAAASTATK